MHCGIPLAVKHCLHKMTKGDISTNFTEFKLADAIGRGGYECQIQI